MSLGFGRPEWLLLLVPLAAWWWFFLRSDRRTRAGRAAVLALVALAIADPRCRSAEKADRITLLVDRSRSMRGRGLAKAGEVAALLARAGRGTQVEVLGFGQGAAVLSSPGEAPHLEGVASQDESDLAAGLELVAATAPGDRPQAVLLVSDGEYSGRDPLREAAALGAKRVPVYVLPVIEPRPAADTAIVSLETPARAVRGQAFPITVLVESPARQEAKIRLMEGTDLLAESSVQLEAGDNPLRLQWAAGAPGLREYAVEVEVPSDPVPENDRAAFALSVLGPPAVLVANAEGAESAVVVARRRAGYEVSVITGGLSSTARLSAYDAVVLENVALDQLGDGADVALRRYVDDLGGGLLVTGGRSSFAAGGFYRSALEQALPVSLDRPGELRRPRLALAMALDRSGSMAMAAEGGGGVTKMDLADRSAAEGVRLLQPDDEIAVFAVDSEAHRVVPLSTVGEAGQQAITRRILSIESAGGGIFVHEALSAAARELLSSTASAKHLLLYADAADSEEPEGAAELVADWRRAGGTLSVVALGTEADQDAQLLKDLARAGGGRVVFARDPRNLPRAFAQQVLRISRRTFEEKPTAVKLGPRWGALRMSAAEIPPVGGYNLTFLSPGADELLRSGDENRAPLAAVWQRGLGKVAAVTFEADGPFTGELARWPGYQALLAHLVEAVKRPSSSGEVGVDLTVDGRLGSVRVDLDPAAAAALPERPLAMVFPPDGAEPFEVPLEWRGAYELAGGFRLTQPGPYYVAVRSGSGAPALSPPRSLPYSPEFAPGRSGARGTRTLEAIAAATGGRRIAHVDELRDALRAQAPRGWPLAPLLALLALSLVVLDVAVRRGLLAEPTRRMRALAGPALFRVASIGRWAAGALAGALARRRARLAPLTAEQRAGTDQVQEDGRPSPAPAEGGPVGGGVQEQTIAESESVFEIARDRARKRRG